MAEQQQQNGGTKAVAESGFSLVAWQLWEGLIADMNDVVRGCTGLPVCVVSGLADYEPTRECQRGTWVLAYMRGKPTDVVALTTPREGGVIGYRGWGAPVGPCGLFLAPCDRCYPID
uniref:Uncharacterized protein n=1 Tax=Vitrella brassicaformis TaxID=1169539 RepID=A0A7S1PCS1_9ALVE|mmetsp:Transcript_53179/g.133879  ORF Transcript_53179/g.133879 Transcript_53179/m.133879 type:complete len:117 (+) Transcript_53179:347-697(+)